MAEIEIVSGRTARVTWRSLWGGLFMVAGVQILMQLFGIAIGVSAIGPSPGALQGVSLWQGSWAIVSTLSAYFFGGWVAASLLAPARRSDGILTGALLWGFATTLGMMLVSAGLFGAIGIGRALIVPPGSRAARGVAAMYSGYTIGAAWATFATVLVSLGCAIGGALVGLRGQRAPAEPLEPLEPFEKDRRVPAGPLTPSETY